MAQLATMPPVVVPVSELAVFGTRWFALGGRLSRTPPQSSGQLGSLFNKAVADPLATMLGGIPVVATGKKTALVAPKPDCVEVGDIPVIGGIRSQQFDVAYRPDGVRFAFDSKTLNDKKSIGKNFANMVNDLGTEAANVHSRFPHALVAFVVALPRPCIPPSRQATMIEILTRLALRDDPDDPAHEAEAISLVVWHPDTGVVDPDIPDQASPLRIEKFSEYVQRAYYARYSTLPPHDR